MQILKEPFKSQWENKDVFAQVKQLQGETYRQVGTRRTIQFNFAEESYFLKYHSGTTIREILKNIVTLKMPVLGADNEWQAINRLKRHGIATMEGVAYGKKNWNPLNRESFIITEDLNPAISLEDFCQDWKVNRPSPSVKYTLIRSLASTVRRMHQIGINHRDCYLCHFLLKQSLEGNEGEVDLFIIDLHRAQSRHHVPRRWRDKDLIGLYYSTLELGLNARDYLYFLKIYTGLDYSSVIKKEARLIKAALKKSQKIQQRTIRKSL
ncbi:MAG: lipopolysaccharide core heptose(I) kinase RfaP [Enterobacterales bacterium endosymbiont of Blomia tropicalis]|uniref:lipopolysaccharide core heptose(I) kinase RfaP n=1 Tax=Mixta mediterraneensis TaxID=2758443 RepID=UPI001873E499|nr:lipopolysaccharide core heptose(I) kinase RfaP [Mixta mediterraneensis]MBE5253804.1 lipopolysaccharide core heptose(I) kinase RfaP [Mixta mediterraneensis]MDL4914485.1 lipopolysaccharide core heptose(I) kinase RfaP [Mixta mediterraneensis]